MFKKVSEDLMSFVRKSPTAFHVVENIREELLNNGFIELLEGRNWVVEEGKNYFVTRNNSSIIALKVGKQLDHYGINIAASHSDSPTFKIKENAEISLRDRFLSLNTEGYGVAICSTWMDRPLSIAGRLLIRDGDSFISHLINIERNLLMIPNAAIHMNRNINDGYKYNFQIDMLPLLGGKGFQAGDFKRMIAHEVNIDVDSIVGSDLFLYNRTEPTLWGMNNEFLSCPQLDDLQCAYASFVGFLNGYNDQSINVYACFDSEEIGSKTKQGAASTFLYDILKRVHNALGKSEDDFYRALASSFMLSADNAHAVHPNHPNKTDATNCVYMNEGVVVKSNASQTYMSDAISVGIVKGLAKNAGVPLQFYANRSDVRGGSTLGNLAMAQVAMNGCDIGLPQLAMHSSYETTGTYDTYYMVKLMEEFFNSHIEEHGRDILKIVK